MRNEQQRSLTSDRQCAEQPCALGRLLPSLRLVRFAKHTWLLLDADGVADGNSALSPWGAGGGRRRLYFRYSTLTTSARPSSCRICRRSVANAFTESAETVTANSSPILRSEPARSFGRIFVPSRFHTSGGTVPTRRSVRVEAAGLGPGPGVGPGSGGGPGSGPGVGPGGAGCPALSASAVAFRSRNTPASKATSSGASISLNHIRSYAHRSSCRTQERNHRE